MAVADAIVVAVIGIVIIEGIWLGTLTYLMWRRARRAQKELVPDEPPKPAA